MARLRSACCRLPSACCACWSAGRDPRPLGGAGLPVRLPLRCCGSAATDVALAAPPAAAAPTEPALPEEGGPAEGEGSAEDLGADAGLPGAALALSPCLPPPPAWACPAGAFDMPTPLSTKPATPWSCSGSAYSCALTER